MKTKKQLTKRKFAGKYFNFHTMFRTLKQAEETKTSLKNRGYYVRIVKSGDYSGTWYDVWKRKSRKS